MTKAETLMIIAMLRTAFPNATVPEETIELYAMMIADLDYQAANDAALQLMTTTRFFPSIAEIRQAAVERQLDLAPAEIAWGEVMQAIRDVGSYGAPAWSSPTLAAAVRAIGWAEICQTEQDQLGVLRAQFRDIYRVYRQRAVNDANWLGLGLDSGHAPRLPNGTEGMRRAGAVVPFGTLPS